MSYDREADVLSMEIDKKTPILYAEEMDNLVIHFSKNNRSVLVELLEASKHLRRNRHSIKYFRELVSPVDV